MQRTTSLDLMEIFPAAASSTRKHGVPEADVWLASSESEKWADALLGSRRSMRSRTDDNDDAISNFPT